MVIAIDQIRIGNKPVTIGRADGARPTQEEISIDPLKDNKDRASKDNKDLRAKDNKNTDIKELHKESKSSTSNPANNFIEKLKKYQPLLGRKIPSIFYKIAMALHGAASVASIFKATPPWIKKILDTAAPIASKTANAFAYFMISIMSFASGRWLDGIGRFLGPAMTIPSSTPDMNLSSGVSSGFTNWISGVSEYNQSRSVPEQTKTGFAGVWETISHIWTATKDLIKNPKDLFAINKRASGLMQVLSGWGIFISSTLGLIFARGKKNTFNFVCTLFRDIFGTTSDIGLFQSNDKEKKQAALGYVFNQALDVIQKIKGIPADTANAINHLSMLCWNYATDFFGRISARANERAKLAETEAGLNPAFA